MCGIAGILHPSAHRLADAFNCSIAHRGPDDHANFIAENVALIHRRLAIQDLSPMGAQPMYSADGRFVIIYNGEIYNHWELRAELGDDIHYKSTSDTETLLYGFIRLGPKVLDRLNGIFAFAILEIPTGELFIARDHFGVKPLYYYHKKDIFLFSSEIKTFIDVHGFDKSLNIRGLSHYLHYLWSPGEDTPFQYVRKLEAGHYLTINVNHPGTKSIHKYYELPFNGHYSSKSEKELVDELDERLTLAVKRQLLSDVPIGFFLSGGLDSSLIVALAKKLSPGKKLKCFTIDTAIAAGKEGFTEDLPYAKQVAAYLDVDLDVIKADIDILDDFDKMIWHLDEPQADAAPLNVWNICKSAREYGYTVLLGGTGGDDLFSGYRRHKALRFEKVLDKIPRILLKPAMSLLKHLPSGNPTFRRINKLLSSYNKNEIAQRLAQYYAWIPLDILKGLFTDAKQKEMADYDPASILVNSLSNIPEEKNKLNKLLYWDIKYFLTDHNLNYTDKMSMAHGVEVRVPYLDKDLVEFSTRIPPAYKMKAGVTKYLLKKVAERYLPKDVIYRPKTGFGAPVRDWITGPLDKKLADTFHPGTCAVHSVFNCEAVHKLIQQNKNGSIDASYPILALLGIDSWYKQFVAGKNPKKSSAIQNIEDGVPTDKNYVK